MAALHAGYSANGGGGIGDGTTDDARYPVKVGGGYFFTSLTCGRRHSCGILASNRSALCWGLDLDGQVRDYLTSTVRAQYGSSGSGCHRSCVSAPATSACPSARGRAIRQCPQHPHAGAWRPCFHSTVGWRFLHLWADIRRWLGALLGSVAAATAAAAAAAAAAAVPMKHAIFKRPELWLPLCPIP